MSSFERYIRAHPEVEFINATSGGAFIKGAVLKRLKDIKAECGDEGVVREVKTKINAAREEFIPDFEGFRESLNEGVFQLKKIVEDLEKGYEKTKKVKDFFSMGTREYKEELYQISRDMENISIRLRDNLFVKVLLFGSGGYKFVRLEMELKLIKLKVEAQKKMCESAHEVYKEFLDSARFILENCEKLLEREELCCKVKSIS